ncbi:hypothetical protein D9M71_195240 [compost metagenome]
MYKRQGIDYGNAGAPLLPGFQFLRCVAPGQGFGFSAEGAVLRNTGETGQDVLVELAPEQFVDPADNARAATVELSLVVAKRRVQALAGREHSGGEIGRELAGARVGREVPAFLVAPECFEGEGLQPFLGRRFACRPELAQTCRWSGETIHRSRRRVTGNAQFRLRHRWRQAAWQGSVQALVADLAELAVDLEIAA